MSTFIINVSNSSIVGFVQNAAVAAEKAGEHLVVSSAIDLQSLSNSELTALYNAATGETRSTFKTAKTESTVKVFNALSQMPIGTLTQLDASDDSKITAAAETLPAGTAPAASDKIDGPKVRKVRDSKLQRMKAAFLQQDEHGKYKIWTIKELMEVCSKSDDPMSERIAHVYISILRSPTDRFIMNIAKVQAEGEVATYFYSPESEAATA